MNIPSASLGLAIIAALSTTHSWAEETMPPLAASKGCVACHDIATKKVGPSYRDVAQKYAGQKDAVAKLTQKVLDGGSGVWGQVAMPPNKAMGVSPADAKQLVTWILSLKTPTANKK